LGAAFRIDDASVSDKRAWVLKSGSLRASPPFLRVQRESNHRTRGSQPQVPKSRRLRNSRHTRRLARRARASGVRRPGLVIRRAGPELVLLGSQPTASIQGAQLPAERPQARPRARPSHSRRERPSPSIPQVRVDHGCDSCGDVRATRISTVGPSIAACINRPARRYTRWPREVNETIQENRRRGRQGAARIGPRKESLLDAGVR